MYAGRIACCIVGLLSVSAPVWALDPVQILAPSDAASGYSEGFGQSVAISGDWLVIGAPYDDELEYDAGAAYVFRRSGAQWVEQQKLYDLSPSWEGGFGSSVAIDSDWIVVGAPGIGVCAGCGIGSGVLFRRDDRGTPQDLSDDYWLYAAALHPPPSHLCCKFGTSVAFHGDSILVGSLRGEFDAGRAYAFEWNGKEWTGPQTIVPLESQVGDEFGSSVSLHGFLGVIGAKRADGVADQTGAAYVFRRTQDGWSQEARLIASDGEDRDFFGGTVRVGADMVVIGARNNRHCCGTRGAAYVFIPESGIWYERSKVFPNTPTLSTDVGWSLGIDGDRLLVGATEGPKGYLFEVSADTWVETAMLDGPADYVAAAVAIDRLFAVVGSHLYAVGEAFDLVDFAQFQNCLTPPSESVPPTCKRFDLERDDRVDVKDLSLLLLTFRGP